jgi:rhamnosyltransferase
MHHKISVIVRSKNEETTVGVTLQLIRDQTVKPKEIILVDNASTDNTKAVAKRYGCTIVNIEDEKFNHAYSCNLGAEVSTGDLIVFTNGHAFPGSPAWLENGIRHFEDSNVAGVYGMLSVDHRASFPERFVEIVKSTLFGRPRVRVLRRASIFNGLGLMNTDSAVIRRDLWEQHPFDVEVSRHGGGEDSEWGFHYLRRGYRVIEDAAFGVYHCHGDSLLRYVIRACFYYHTYLLAYNKNTRP